MTASIAQPDPPAPMPRSRHAHLLGALLCLASLALAACSLESRDEGRSAGHGAAWSTHAERVPPGTSPRGTLAYLAAVAPPGPPSTPALLERGRDRYAIHCAVCHGDDGSGHGRITTYGFPRPPPLAAPASGRREPAWTVEVIGNGFGRMAGYADRLPPSDRWAVAHWVAALVAKATAAGPTSPASGVAAP